MKNSLWTVLNLAWELGYLIALPIVILGFGGAWLDKKFGTSPILLLAGIGLSVIISGIAVYRKIKVFNS
jgi:hypothetical protein